MGWTVTGGIRGLSVTILIGTIALLAGCVSQDSRAPEREERAQAPPDSAAPRDQQRDDEAGPPPEPTSPDHREDEEPEDRAPAGAAPPEEPQPAQDPAVTQDLPRVSPLSPLPPRRVRPVPPDTATPEQLARIREYYGIRSVPAITMDITVEPIIDAPATAVGYIRRGLEQGGMRGTATVAGPAGEHRAALAITIAGDQLTSRQYHYARAVVAVRYRTGPGLRLGADRIIRGPYRLSQVSPADAVLRSLFAIPGAAYATALGEIDDAWSTGVAREGLPYQIEHPPDREGCLDGPFFEVPPLLQHQLMLWSRDSDCDYLVEPLTGIIRIVYNGTT